VVQRKIVRFIKERRTIKVLHIFRGYSALIVVVSSALLVSATNFAAGRESSGFLFGYFGTSENYDSPLKDKIFLKASNRTNITLAPLAEASSSPDPNNKGDDQGDLPTVQGQALLSSNSPVKKDPEEDGGVVIYEVQSGDTVSSIAASHHVSINTIMWANDLNNVDEIMPGDKIFILPVSGLSYTVKKGDDIGSIADKYKSDKDKIIAFNNLPANGDLTEGQEIIIPDGQGELPQNQTQPAAPTGALSIPARNWQSFGSTSDSTSDSTSGSSVSSGKPGAGHSYPYGYCTWYVSQKRYIPWSGNAGTWLYHAKAAGYATGHTPKPGAIMVTSESWWGHVALVESVSGSTFTVSEMNYEGFGKKDIRTVDASSRVIKGFIYK